MNKLLKVTLITAIMATSGMCGGDITRGPQSPVQNQCCEMMTKGALCAAAAYTAHKALCGECQHTTFDADSEYSQDYTISGNTWITDTESDWTDITGDVKITGLSRWINKGWIGLNGEENIIDHSEVINKGRIGVLGEEGNPKGILDVTGNSSIYLRHGAGIGAYDGGILNVKGNSSISLSDDAYIRAFNGGILDVTDNSSVSLRDGAYIQAYEGGINVTDNSTIYLKDSAYIRAYGEGGILDVTDNSSISLRDGSYINAYDGGILDVKDNSSISLSDDAYIGADGNSTIIINEGSIFDARDSKDLREWNTFDGTFNMKAGSIMYLPSTDIDDGKKATEFTITLPSEGDKPVELRYIQHTDITFDGLCPNATHSGYKYKLSGWKKGTTDIDDPDNPGTTITVPYLQEPNTGIRFTWKGINKDTTMTIPPSIAKLVPIHTWSVSTKCNGEDVKILESRDLQCCDDILW